MSHLIEEYAKNLGVKISKPIVAKHFWPVLPEKYIVVYLEPEQDAKKYKYYNIVFDAIHSHLTRENIKVIQIGSSRSEALDVADEIIFDLDFKKFAYIISKSLLYVGVDSQYSHYASSIDIPIVTIFGNSYASVFDGYWSGQDSKTNIEAPWEIKPSWNAFDPQDSINKIKPEIIAQSILDKLKFKIKTPLKTLFIGEFFNKKVYELVPDFFVVSESMKNKHWFIRCDFVEEGSYIESWCDFLTSFSFFTKKIIQPEFFAKYKDKIENINFIVDRESVIPDGYLNYLSSLDIKVCLLVENEADLAFIRNKFFDHTVQIYFQNNKEALKDKEIKYGKSFFSSSKTLVSKGKKYPSIFHWKNNQYSLDKNLNIVDNDDLLKELNHFYIYDIE